MPIFGPRFSLTVAFRGLNCEAPWGDSFLWARLAALTDSEKRQAPWGIARSWWSRSWTGNGPAGIGHTERSSSQALLCGCGSKSCSPGEHQNRRQMDVHPPNGAMFCPMAMSIKGFVGNFGFKGTGPKASAHLPVTSTTSSEALPAGHKPHPAASVRLSRKAPEGSNAQVLKS